MLYVSIGLSLIGIILAARLFFLRQALWHAAKQMDEIELHPESNRQLKSSTTDKRAEILFKKVNNIYQARQKERIIYQKRETQIRREIENISHDLRTPLTSIIGYVELIKDDMTVEEERREYLEVIQKRARVLQGFIQDFYELSRVEAEDYPLLLEIVQVQNILSETVVSYYHEFEKRQIEVTVDFEEKPSHIIADRIQLNRILNNLIQNTLKYARDTFILKQYTQEGECVLRFSNDKNRMRDGELNLIFDRFYTGDPARSSQSTGLGLTIVKLLTEKMKGHIEARIEGDLFVIELRFKLQDGVD